MSFNENLAWPDIEHLCIDYLNAAIDTSIPYAAGVTVTNRPSPAQTDPMPTPMVTCRRNGGIRVDQNTDRPRVMVQVWHDTDQDAADLAAYIRDLLRQMKNAPVDGYQARRIDEFLGPTPILDPDTQTPRVLFTVEITLLAVPR